MSERPPIIINRACPTACVEKMQQLEADNARLKGVINELQEDKRQFREKLRECRTVQDRLNRGEVWYWQDDEYDHPESLVCPVIMDAEQLRELLRQKERLRELTDALEFIACCDPQCARDWDGVVKDDCDTMRETAEQALKEES